jgi:hypothetical protein
MDTLIGYFANHSEGLRAALALDGEALDARGAPRISGWTVVSAFRGEALVRSRPHETREITEARDVLEGLRTDRALVTLRRDARRVDSIEEGGPFRFGWWSSVVVGAEGRSPSLRAAVLARSSDLLARLSGPRSAGHGVFALFLSRLHGSIGLDDTHVDRAALESALAETLATWVEECARASERAGSLVIAVTHRELLAVASLGAPLRTLRRSGMRDRALLERLRGKELGKLDPERLRYVWITTAARDAARDPRERREDDRWVVHAAERGVTLTVDRHCDLHVKELSISADVGGATQP